PDPAESGFAHDARRQAVVRLHQELELRALEHAAQLGAAARRDVVAGGCVHAAAPDKGRSCGTISWAARATSCGKSISIHGAPVTSTNSTLWLRSSSRSRTASSCGRCE